MKTRHIASGIGSVIALLGSIGAIGCGADVGTEGAAGEGEIGSAALALTTNDVAGLDTLELEEGFEHAASCRLVATIDNVQVPKIVVYGGYDDTGTGIDALYAYRPGNDTWEALPSIASQIPLDGAQGRGEAEFVQLTDTSCLLVGGLSTKETTGTTGVTKPNVYQLSVSGNTFTWTKKGSLNVGRAKFGVAKCSSSSVIVIGGHTGALGTIAGAGTANFVERFNGTSWAGIGDPLSAQSLSPVHSFGFAADMDNSLQFVIAGGMNAGGTARHEVIPLVATASEGVCTDIDVLTDGSEEPVIGSLLENDQSPAAQGRFGDVAFFRSSSDQMLVAAGDTGASLPTYAEKFSVTWSGTPGISHDGYINVTNDASSPVGVRYPELVLAGSDDWILVGGEDRSDADPLEAAPQLHTIEFTAPSGAFAFDEYEPLGTVRLGAAVAYDATSNKVIATAGMQAQTPTLLLSAEAIVP